MKNLITITNLHKGYESTIVDNFSKENIVKTVAKFLAVDANDVHIDTSSMSGAICSISKNCKKLKKNLKAIDGLEDYKDDILVRLIFGTIV